MAAWIVDRDGGASVSATIEHEPTSILDVYGARQWREEDGTWVISIPRQNDKPIVQWALKQAAKEADKLPQLLWVKRKE
jgi:hypothetical protein